MSTDPRNGSRSSSAAFRTTCWTQILQAAERGSSGSEEAFGQLYLDYWNPLYSFIRRRGFSPEAAEDVTQSFFLRLLEKNALVSLRREGGRFRSFLLGAMCNFLANELDRNHAQKRGGHCTMLTLDTLSEEGQYSALHLTGNTTPETLFERRWVMTLLKRVMQRLQTLESLNGNSALFEDIRPHLQSDRIGLAYVEIGQRHEMTEGAVKVAIHRLRKRYGLLLREEIGRTVNTEQEIEEELRYLIQVISD